VVTLPRGSWTTGVVPDTPLEDDPTDVLVVGAGLNGLLAAVGALRRGLSVRVLEAHPHVGRLASGHNTGKVTALQGTQLSSIADAVDEPSAVAYGRAQVTAVSRLRDLCRQLDVPHEDRSAGTVVQDTNGLDVLTRERDLAAAAGMDVDLLTALPEAPYAAAGIVVPQQLQLNPQQLVEALAREVVTLGGRLHLGSRVRRILPHTSGSVVRLVDGRKVRTRDVVVTTGTPILARGGYFARVSAQRSYIVAFQGPPVETSMLLTADSPSRSVRDVRGEPFTLLVGGAGHGVGRAGSEYAGIREICDWAARFFPDHTPLAHWSAQDYTSVDHRPLVEAFRSGRGRVVTVTGMNKWGLTNAVLASDAVVAALTGEADLPGGGRGLLGELAGRGAVRLAGQNAEVAVSEVVGTCRAARDLVAPGDGRPRAAGLCTHLGGTLTWNDAEGSLDCPLHGSRFDADGSVIEGYATHKAPHVRA
jgi:glycine/D-amino acid oxidase-like deaminating enzyme